MNINTKSVMNLPLEALQKIFIETLEAINKAQPGPRTLVLGPPGTTPKVQARLEACAPKFLEMAANGVTSKALTKNVDPDTFRYTDVILVAKHLIEAGLIEKPPEGRNPTWHLVT